MYDTFGDKHTLFMKALENYKKMATAEMKAIVDNAPTAKEAIRKMFEYTVIELLRDDQHKGCFLVNAAVELASHDQEINKMLCENDRQLEKYFHEAIKKGQSTGEISAEKNAHALAQFILNSIKGIRVTSRSGADKKIFQDIIDVTMSVLN
jgi:TetR/AcrR family transcriptional repressor of nem operon